MYVAAFNLNEELLRNFTMPKGRGDDGGAIFDIKYMDAVIDDASYSAEMFIEFVAPVVLHRLAERLEELGAGSVHIDTFQHNDHNKSAADCLARIWREAAKTKAYKRGVCSPALLARATTTHQGDGMSQAAFDEKTARATQVSLERIDNGLAQTSAGITAVGGSVDAMVIEVTAVHGVVTGFSLAENECKRLRDLVVEKTLLADRVEYSKGGITRERNEALAKVVAADAGKAEAERVAEQCKWALEYERMLGAGVNRELARMARENMMLHAQNHDYRAQAQLNLMQSQRDHQQIEDLRAQVQFDYQQIEDLRQQVSALRSSP